MTRQKHSKPPSQRQLRVGEEMRHVLAQILARGELRDPAIAERHVTVTEVRVSPDLRNATVFVVPLGGRGLDELVGALNHASGFLRSRLGQDMRLRFLPTLRFAADHSFDEAARIDSILERPSVRRDLSLPEDATPDESAVGGADKGPAGAESDDR